MAPSVIDVAIGSLESGASLERAREAARRRLPALRRGRPERLPSRLRDYLLRRGFGASIVMRVVREVTGADSET